MTNSTLHCTFLLAGEQLEHGEKWLVPDESQKSILYDLPSDLERVLFNAIGQTERETMILI